MKRFAIYALVFEAAALLLLAFLTVQAPAVTGPQTYTPLDRLLLVDRFSNRLYEDSVRRFAGSGDTDVGGFMKAFDPNVHIAAVTYIDGGQGGQRSRSVYPYISNFSLQYVLGKWLTLGRANLADPAIIAFEVFCATGMAMTVAGIAVVADREFGSRAGIGIVAVCALSPAFLARALSPYWVMFLSFMPFLVALWLYPRWQARRLWSLEALIALLTFVKSLTGYEYLSNVALGPVVAVVFYELRAHLRWDRACLGVIVRRSILFGAAAVVGFLAAVALHVWKASLYFGSLQKGLMAFTLPLTYSTMESASGIRGTADPGGFAWARAAASTLVSQNFVVSLPLYVGVVVCGLVVFARHRGSPAASWNSLTHATRALCGALVVSGLASASWLVLAQRHSLLHAHINWIVTYLFFNIFAVALLSNAVSSRRPAADM